MDAPKEKANPLRLQQMKDRCREIEEQVARSWKLGWKVMGRNRPTSKAAEESVRLAKLIEDGREEISRLMREWEETAKAVEEQETEAG